MRHAHDTLTVPDTQLRDEDDAARMRSTGSTWAAIAAEIGISVSVAKAYVQASDARADRRAMEHQTTLFDLG